jgi:hypothetical protein
MWTIYVASCSRINGLVQRRSRVHPRCRFRRLLPRIRSWDSGGPRSERDTRRTGGGCGLRKQPVGRKTHGGWLPCPRGRITTPEALQSRSHQQMGIQPECSLARIVGSGACPMNRNLSTSSRIENSTEGGNEMPVVSRGPSRLPASPLCGRYGYPLRTSALSLSPSSRVPRPRCPQASSRRWRARTLSPRRHLRPGPPWSS